jgi:hypothetical protein
VKKPQPKIGKDAEQELRKQLAGWGKELRKLLPALPKQIEIIFDNNVLVDVTGTGGYAISKNKLALAFHPNFSGDKARQLINFKGAYFHESYHLVQGFTMTTAPDILPAINNAVYEGAAAVFERDRSGADPLWVWGKYETSKTMKKWFDEIKSLPLKYDWRRYKIYDKKTGRRWVMYKVGTFVADEAIKKNPKLSIEDLATMPPEEILKLSQL